MPTYFLIPLPPGGKTEEGVRLSDRFLKGAKKSASAGFFGIEPYHYSLLPNAPSPWG